jgi:hypothetical protein
MHFIYSGRRTSLNHHYQIAFAIDARSRLSLSSLASALLASTSYPTHTRFRFFTSVAGIKMVTPVSGSGLASYTEFWREKSLTTAPKRI